MLAWIKKDYTLHWRHNGHDSVSNHQPHDCLLNRLLRRRSKKTSKLCVTGLRVGNSPGPVNSPHKWPVTGKMFPFDDVIMTCLLCPRTLFSRFPALLKRNRYSLYMISLIHYTDVENLRFNSYSGNVKPSGKAISKWYSHRLHYVSCMQIASNGQFWNLSCITISQSAIALLDSNTFSLIVTAIS